MFPIASAHSATSRKRGIADLDPAGDAPVKRRAVEAAPSQTDITRLQDLPVEVHSAFAAFMPAADTVQYARALPQPMCRLSEAPAAALSLDIAAAHTFTQLRGLAARLPSIHPAFRHRPILEMRAVLRQLAQRLPLHGAVPLQGLLHACRQASTGLVGWRAGRLQLACDEVDLMIDMRRARSAGELLALTRQVPQLLATAQRSALLNSLRAVYRVLHAGPMANAPTDGLQAVVLETMHQAGGLSASDNATVLRGVFQVLAETGRQFNQQPWPQAQLSLCTAVARLPAPEIHRAVPTKDDQFVETIVDIMGNMTETEGLAFYDAMLSGIPPTGRARLDALTNMAALLMEVPDEAIPSRLARICDEVGNLDQRLAHRENVLLELASEAIFRTLPAAQVPVAIGQMLETGARCGLGSHACEELCDELADRVGLAPPEARAGLRAALRQAQDQADRTNSLR